MTRLALLLVVAQTGCWREGPGPAPPPLRPEPTSPEPVPDPSRGTGWRVSDPVASAQPASVPTRTTDQIAADLATELRTQGPVVMPSYIAGPAVVLDLDAGSLYVACDATAVTNAQLWGQQLVDPQRPKPHCRGGSPNGNFTCSQFATQTILVVELADPDQWRIVSVIVGNFRNGRATMNAKIGQMRSLIATAACP